MIPPADHPILPTSPTIPQMQKYIQTVVEYRGFDKNTVQDNFIMLCEEVGELAKALRIFSDVKLATDSNIVDLQHEVADVFWMLACVCNQLDVDIESAVRIKDERNKHRVWLAGQPM